ncbi:MAG: hypothetical protein ACYS5V_00960 [Planctomycetota bacterium]|jgi:hypothetical protein
MKYRCLWAIAVCGSVGLTGGCVTSAPRPPRALAELVHRRESEAKEFTPRTVALYNVRRVLSPSLRAEERLASMRVVETLAVDLPEAYAALVSVLGDSGAPQELRADVLEFLARRRQPGLARHVAEALSQVTDAGMRQAILEWLESSPSPMVLAGLVKLWAAQDKPDELEEQRYRRIVQKITGEPWDEALLGRLNDPASFPRGSALEVLSHRLPPKVLRQRIAALPARTPAVQAMQRMIEGFGVLPGTRYELLAAVVALGDDPGRVPGAATLADAWKSKYGYGFNIRDLHLLEQLSTDPLRNAGMSRRQLVVEVSQAIARRRSGDAGSGLRGGQLVDFDAQTEILSMADLWNLFLLNETFSRNSTQLALRITAAEDRADRSTRWGGLVAYEHGRAAAKLYRPAVKRGDDQYVPSQRFLSDAMSSLCFFVGHFSAPVDPSPAGRATRELDLARRYNLYGVVLTTLDDNLINATYLNPRGVLVDLGNFAQRK